MESLPLPAAQEVQPAMSRPSLKDVSRTMEYYLELRRPLNLGVVPQRITLPTKNNSVVIGRGSKADVFLYAGEHPSFVSREHAKLELDETIGKWRISDLESVNGMFYNSVKLTRDDRVALNNGDRVYFGNPQHSFFVEYEFIAMPRAVSVSPFSTCEPPAPSSSSSLDYGSDSSCSSSESKPLTPARMWSGDMAARSCGRPSASSSSAFMASGPSVEMVHADIWVNRVFRFLDVREVHIAGLVSRAWKEYSDKSMGTTDLIRWRHPWSVDVLVQVLTKRSEMSSLPIRTIITEGCYKVRDDHVEIIARLAGPTLVHADFSGTPALTPRGMRAIATSCPMLKTLIVRGCKRVGGGTWEWMDTLASQGMLEYIDLHCAGANDVVVSKLASKCPKLRRVDLGVMCTEGVTNVGLLELTEHCSLLEHVDLRGCKRIGDDGVALLVQKCGPHLKTLVLHSCDIGDDALRAIGQSCPRLEVLDLHRCTRITDAGIEGLVNGEAGASIARTLRQLDLSNLNITDAGLEHLTRSKPALTVLDLRSCKWITGRGLGSFIRSCASTLLKLDLNGCNRIQPIDVLMIAKLCRSVLQELEIGAREEECASWTKGDVDRLRTVFGPQTRVHDAFDYPTPRRSFGGLHSMRASS